MEVWRLMHINNEVHSFNSSEHYYRQRDSICQGKSSNINELKQKMTELGTCYHNYEMASGKSFDNECKKHDYMKIVPQSIYTMLTTNFDITNCNAIGNNLLANG